MKHSTHADETQYTCLSRSRLHVCKQQQQRSVGINCSLTLVVSTGILTPYITMEAECSAHRCRVKPPNTLGRSNLSFIERLFISSEVKMY